MMMVAALLVGLPSTDAGWTVYLLTTPQGQLCVCEQLSSYILCCASVTSMVLCPSINVTYPKKINPTQFTHAKFNTKQLTFVETAPDKPKLGPQRIKYLHWL